MDHIHVVNVPPHYRGCCAETMLCLRRSVSKNNPVQGAMWDISAIGGDFKLPSLWLWRNKGLW
jgi:hypothetical protein